MDRKQAIELLAGEPPIEPGQKFAVDTYRPEDAWSIAKLYYSVYGDSYPVDTPYVPDLLNAAVATGDIRMSVLRTPSGDIVGKTEIYRSSPPNPRLREIGQFLVLPEYRGPFGVVRATDHVLKHHADPESMDGLYGENVTAHLVTQKLGERSGFTSTAIELGLMPAEAYARDFGATKRVSCVLAVKSFLQESQRIHLSSRIAGSAPLLLEGFDAPREVVVCDDAPPAGSRAEMAVQRFDGAGVVRLNVTSPGADLLDRVKAELDAAPFELAQIWLALDAPWAGGAAEALRELGFSLGGLAPLWCGADALLLHRLDADPGVEEMKLHGEKSKRILDLILVEREAVLRGA